jgi:hypothetical protein
LPADQAGRSALGAQAVGLALALTPITPSSSSGTGGIGDERLRLHIRDGVPDAKMLTRIEEELGDNLVLERKRGQVFASASTPD